MPTYAQLQTEDCWQDEYVTDVEEAFGRRVAARLSCAVYHRGDNEHLTGRHRSRRWVAESVWCTNPVYGTRSTRDTSGPPNAVRADDIMISGRVLWAVCRGVDEAKRAGRLRGLAEWFGSTDGKTVVGWFEGHESTSDLSHLDHLHLGHWTDSVNDQAYFDELFDAMTKYLEDDMDAAYLNAIAGAGARTRSLIEGDEQYEIPLAGGGTRKETNWLVRQIKQLVSSMASLLAKHDALAAAFTQLAAGGGVDAAPIVAAVDRVGTQLGTRIGELQNDVDQLTAENARLRVQVEDRDRRLAEAYAAGAGTAS